MVMQIRVTGLKETRQMLNKLPKNIQTEVRDKGIPYLAKNLQTRIKRSFMSKGYGRGPSSSGASRRSIKYRKTPKGAIVEILAPWLVLIEKGVKSHWVSRYTIKQHIMHPGSTMFKKAPAGKYGGKPVYWRYKGPFIDPAVQRFIPTISPKLIKFVKKAISKSRR